MLALLVLLAGCGSHPDGIDERYFKDGKVRGTYTYKGGKLNGEVKTYYHSPYKRIGRVRTEANYVDGKLHGTLKRFSPDGTLAAEAEFKAGVKKSETIHQQIEKGEKTAA